MQVKLLRHTPLADEVVYVAGRKCYSTLTATEILEGLYKKYPDAKERQIEINRFIKARIADDGHTSICDHVQFVFDVSGISRITETQLVRARIGSGFSIQSGRYTNGSNASFTMPQSFKDVGLDEEFVYLIEEEKKFYTEAVKRITARHIQDGIDPKKAEKMACEDARYSFSQSLNTALVLSFDGTALLHFLKLRTCSHAQWEIRRLALEIYQLVKEVAPGLLQGIYPECHKCSNPCGTFRNYLPNINIVK